MTSLLVVGVGEPEEEERGDLHSHPPQEEAQAHARAVVHPAAAASAARVLPQLAGAVQHGTRQYGPRDGACRTHSTRWLVSGWQCGEGRVVVVVVVVGVGGVQSCNTRTMEHVDDAENGKGT